MGGGRLSPYGTGRLTMAGTEVSKAGPSPDQRMQQAAVKSEPDVIVDPRGTAVNTALPLPSPRIVS